MIIKSLLETDLYKINMGCVYFHHFTHINGKFEFKCRNKDVKFTPAMLDRINQELDNLCSIRFTEPELEYIQNLPWLKHASGYIEFLRNFKLNRNHVEAKLNGGELKIIADGPMMSISHFEIPTLSIVSEVYHSFKNAALDMGLAESKLSEKINRLNNNPITFSEFGLRRRFSSSWQEHVVERLKNEVKSGFVGTSNVYLAKKFGIKPAGTMAHEYICLGQALDDVTLKKSQEHMLNIWAKEFRGSLGIALSDTLGIDKFIKDFDLYLAKLFDGIRQDSGDPDAVAGKVKDMYDKLGLDSKMKTILFSDCLDIPKAIDLHNRWKDSFKVAFGIGTNFVCDVGIEPLQCVMKLTEANGKPVAKISDSAGKLMCNDDEYVAYLKKQL